MGKRKKSKRTKEEQKHYNMSRIRSRNTKIEIRLRKALWHSGIRYRIDYATLPGRPDIAITKHRIAIFCDGEFWHGKDWRDNRERILSNREYWIPKIERNIRRDAEIDKQLTLLGWQVIRFWGKDIEKHTDRCVQEVQEAIIEAVIQKADTDAVLPYLEEET